MKKKLNSLLVILVSAFMLILTGCGGEKTTAVTNEEYYNYLTTQYNYYFKDQPLYTTYDIYVDDYTYDGTYDEFITSYSDSYADLRTKLEDFRTDLKNYSAKGNTEVEQLNAKIITAVDKAIDETDKYTATFGEKTKDFATLAKDEVVRGLRDIENSPHAARKELDKLITDAKTDLGIK